MRFSETVRSYFTTAAGRQILVELIGFWFLGLCNNFGYVVMLSAAHDILKEEDGGNSTSPKINSTNDHDCNPTSTGAILLADILPALVIKVTAPLYVHKIHYNIRFALMVLFAAAALIIVGTVNIMALSLLGVACASISSGFGEITILQLTSFYGKHTITGWSSGTGGAGVLGALSYAALTGPIGLSPKTTMLVLLFIPVLQVISYLMVGASRAVNRLQGYEAITTEGISMDEEEKEIVVKQPAVQKDWRTRLRLVRPLLKYMIPLTLVYFAEYLINQGLYELVYLKKENIKHSDQYRWYSVCYQIGVFISRSSVPFVRINQLWILPIIQFINLGIFFVCVLRTAYIPSIWLIFGLIVFEGLIGGGAYVNTFYKISVEIPEENREFSMGVASIGDSFGITLAGLLAIPLHNVFCD